MYIISLLLSTALAQEVTNSFDDYPYFNAQSFRPSIDSKPFFWVTDSSLSSNKFIYKGLFTYTDSPLTYTDHLGEEHAVIEYINQLDLIAGYRYKNLRFGVAVPVFLGTAGLLNQQLSRVVEDGLSSDAISESLGFGDTVLDLKYRVFEGTVKPIGLAASARATLPTNNSYLPLGTDGSLIEVEANIDKKIKDLRLAANIGHRTTQEAALSDAANQAWGAGAYARWGLSYSKDDMAGVSLELMNSLIYDENTDGSSEALVSIWTPLQKTFIKTGFGIGMGSGIATPKYRLLFSLEPHSVPAVDSDGDGIMDKQDACPAEPEDIDGIMDDDGCIDLTTVTVSVVDEAGKEIPNATWKIGERTGASGSSFDYQVLDGNQISATAKAEGYQDGAAGFEISNGEQVKIAVVLKKQEAPKGSILVEVTDLDGNPIEGVTWSFKGLKRGEGYPAGELQEAKPGKKNIQIRAKGYKPVSASFELHSGKKEVISVKMAPSKANVSGNKIEISDSVYFASGKDVILEKSYALLKDVAEILNEHDNIKKVEIEGHTDSDGSAQSNKELSQKRAEAVRSFLIKEGVSGDRLVAIGYGEEKPIADNATKAGKALNRRVHFHIAEFTVEKAPEAQIEMHEEKESNEGSE